MSTVEAERVLLDADVSRARRKRVIDQLAATVILEGYLRYRALQRENPER
jgi:putative Holliday junction resolvase